MRTLTHEEARRVYDRIGVRQDTQTFYEKPATDRLISNTQLGSAKRLFEFGSGTGRLAAQLLTEHLPPTATYRAVDVSPTMVHLARSRLADFGTRAEVVLTDGSPPSNEPAGAFDRFISTYVLDLLSEEEIRAVLFEAHRMLEPGGLICLAGLTFARRPLSKGFLRVWSWIYALNPALVGGCRPVELLSLLPPDGWSIRHHSCVAPFAVPSEVLVAERL